MNFIFHKNCGALIKIRAQRSHKFETNTHSLLSKVKFVRSEYVSKYILVHMNGGTCTLPCRNERCRVSSGHFLIKQSYLGPLPYLFARVKKKIKIPFSVLVC